MEKYNLLLFLRVLYTRQSLFLHLTYKLIHLKNSYTMYSLPTKDHTYWTRQVIWLQFIDNLKSHLSISESPNHTLSSHFWNHGPIKTSEYKQAPIQTHSHTPGLYTVAQRTKSKPDSLGTPLIDRWYKSGAGFLGQNAGHVHTLCQTTCHMEDV